MPKYHFHSDGQRDEDGTDLANLEEAKCEAVKLAGNTICEEAAEFWDKAEWSLTVTDSRGLTLFQLQIIGTEAPVAWDQRRSRQTSA